MKLMTDIVHFLLPEDCKVMNRRSIMKFKFCNHHQDLINHKYYIKFKRKINIILLKKNLSRDADIQHFGTNVIFLARPRLKIQAKLDDFYIFSKPKLDLKKNYPDI